MNRVQPSRTETRKPADEGESLRSTRSRITFETFNFRGIDAVMNVVCPVLREHGVFVVPQALKQTSEEYESKQGGRMVCRVLEIGFTVFGTLGDHFNGIAYGEASDSGYKGTPKAMSVALRTFLLQALCIPTDEPDPDASSYERASGRPVNTQPQQPPAPVGNPESQKARDDLEAVAAENNWHLSKVAEAFSAANQGGELKDASASPGQGYSSQQESQVDQHARTDVL